jgi:hypothetical protein
LANICFHQQPAPAAAKHAEGRHDMRLLAILIVTATGLSALSVSALAQQRGLANTTCSNTRVGNTIFMRCQGQNTRDFLLPKSGGTTDPAAAGKPYGSWSSSFGDPHWHSPAMGR